MMELLKQVTLWLAAGVEAAAALVIGLAAIEAFLQALVLFVPGHLASDEPDAKEVLRLKGAVSLMRTRLHTMRLGL